MAVLSRPKTLVLDLDETLIHSTNNLTGLSSPSGKWNSLSVRVVEVVLDSKSVVYHVYKRPWVDVFLKKVRCLISVCVSVHQSRADQANAPLPRSPPGTPWSSLRPAFKSTQIL